MENKILVICGEIIKYANSKNVVLSEIAKLLNVIAEQK